LGIGVGIKIIQENLPVPFMQTNTTRKYKEAQSDSVYKKNIMVDPEYRA
jgi:hypothetical protein